MTTFNAAVGQLAVIKSQKTWGEVFERTTKLVRITENDGYTVRWEQVKELASENVLREHTTGGFSLNPSVLAHMLATGKLAQAAE